MTKIVDATANTLRDTARLHNRFISSRPPISRTIIRVEKRFYHKIFHDLNEISVGKQESYNIAQGIEDSAHLHEAHVELFVLIIQQQHHLIQFLTIKEIIRR